MSVLRPAQSPAGSFTEASTNIVTGLSARARNAEACLPAVRQVQSTGLSSPGLCIRAGRSSLRER
jgi:hypothetical protein